MISLQFFLIAGLISASPETPANANVAVLNEPDMPVVGAGSSPERIAAILRGAGACVELLSAASLADPQVLQKDRVDIAVIPTGRSFPAEARDNFVKYLHEGGNFISAGGYAFDHLLVRRDGKWLDEQSALRSAREDAMRPERSLLPDGGFESPAEIPIGGVETNMRWRRDGPSASIAAEPAGNRCGRISLPAELTAGSSTFYLDWVPEASQSYEIRCRIKCENISGYGMAYAAVYQHAADGKIVEFRDFAVRRGTTDWSETGFRFAPQPQVARVRIQCGLYLATGAAWFDDFRLGKVTGLDRGPMNTSSGTPADGLDTRAEQIGVFDPSFPLKRVSTLRWASSLPGFLPEELGMKVRGWAATGVVGNDAARWIPLVEARDRYGRLRGAVASVMFHYNGFYQRSGWGFWGVEDRDLFDDPRGPMSKALVEMAIMLSRKTYLHGLRTDQRLYREGETVRVSVDVCNHGRLGRNVSVSLLVAPDPSANPRQRQPIASESFQLAADTRRTITGSFDVRSSHSDLERLVAALSVDGVAVDEMETGFVVERPAIASSAAASRFAENYFTQAGRPLFLFGTDTYSYTYFSAFDNPLTWSRDHLAARDVGIQLYENLQYSQPGFRLSDSDWGAFRAMTQLTQKHNLVFMPGMLIGQNVAASDEDLRRQSELCRSYAEQLGGTPALHYYINGDYQLNLGQNPADAEKLWNRWLAERYPNAAAVAIAWGRGDIGDWGSIPIPSLNSGLWNDVAALDRTRFELWLTRRWNEAHVRAVRELDRQHPIMSEYYQRPSGGLDLPLTIDGQDVADIGYFDEEGLDIDRLPLAIRFNDLRARGKGVSLGEYGVKTHPAWTVENGATHYHVQRTEEEQKQLFMAVAHYALGLGAAKVQNWCLADSQNRVFPWGVFYPNQLIPKDVAYTHRNQSAIWRFFTPRYEPSALTLCVPSGLRLGNRPQVGLDVAYRAVAGLLAGQFQFNVIDDEHLDAIPKATRTILYPSPFTLSDRAERHLLAWVQSGGNLITTGDLSYDEDRRPIRRDRLPNFAGVKWVSNRFSDVDRSAGADLWASFGSTGLPRALVRPCIEANVTSAEPLGTTDSGLPILTRNRVGSGIVYWCADPLELNPDDAANELRCQVYSSLIQATGIEPAGIAPRVPWLHVMLQPTASAQVYVLFNTQHGETADRVTVETGAGEVGVRVRRRWPAMLAVTQDRRIVAVSADGPADVRTESLLAGTGMHAALSLDGKDLRQSDAILYAPFEPGDLTFRPDTSRRTACCGEFRDGAWTTLEEIAVEPGQTTVSVDEDRATCLLLLCQPAQAARWQSVLSGAMTHPERIAIRY